MCSWKLAVVLLLAAVLGSCAPDEREQVDLLVVGGTVVPMDAERRVLDTGAVAVHGERIVAVGLAEELESRYRAGRRLDASGHLVLPGLINAHTHAAMTIYRGIADDLVLEEWLQNYIFPLEASLTTGDLVYWGTKLAALEMIQGGTTTFVDMYYFEEEAARAASEAGIRAVVGETILDFPAPDFPTAAEALRYTEGFIERWRDHPLVVPAVAPHSAYILGAETLSAATALSKRTGAPLLIHLAESAGEMKTLRERAGRTSTQYLGRLGLFDTQVLGAHCVFVDEADRALLARKGVGCVHNPTSNMKLASGVSPVPALRAAGVAVALGTDGPAGSNNDLNLFEEMDLAAKLHKLIANDPRTLPAPDALAMATIEGARAIGLAEEIGSLEPGKRADLILVRSQPPHAFPAYDVYSQVVYSLKASDVETVVVNGQVVMEGRRVLTLDEDEIRRQVERYAAKVREHVARARGENEPSEPGR